MTQETALHLMKSGKNVFITGAPGTGKTHVLKIYIRYLEEHGIPFAVTAPTGIAASHIGGRTIHSFFGLGLKEDLSQRDLEELTEKKYLWDRMRKLKVLIIDEISMLSPKLFRSIDLILRTFKFSMEAFGGVQLVFVGDFFQLPPIQRGENGEKFVFQTALWRELNLSFSSLEFSHRHGEDPIFSLLNAIRKREFGDEHKRILEGRIGLTHDYSVTRLYTHNIDVDRINKSFLHALEGKAHIYEASEKGAKKWRDRIFQTSLLSQTLELKKGAIVFFVKNSPEKGYINGTLGEVVDFDVFDNPIVETVQGKRIKVLPETWEYTDLDGKVLAQVKQIPLRLAWAITIHKSQGMTLDRAEIDLSKSFERGQGYVALSRLRSLSGLYLKGFNQKSFEVDENAFQYDFFVREESKRSYADYLQLSEDEKSEIYESFLKKLGVGK